MADIERLTQKVERNEDVSKELNSLDISDRLRVARQMRAQNQKDRQQDPSLPEMELTIAKDGPDGQEHVYDIAMKPIVELSHAGSWANAFKDTTQVYKIS